MRRFHLLLIILGLAILVGTTLALVPALNEGFLSPNFIDPVLADADVLPPGSGSATYNVYNTAVYALAFLLGLALLWEGLQEAGITLDGSIAVAAVPYMLLGGLVRALEDARLFAPPLQYAFISPLIFAVLVFGVGPALFLIAHLLVSRGRDRWGIPMVMALLLVGLLLAREIGWITSGTFALEGLLVLILISGAYLAWPERLRTRAVAFAAPGVYLLLLGAMAVWSWPNDPDWFAAFSAVDPVAPNVRPWVIPVVVGVASGLALAIWGLTWWVLRRLELGIAEVTPWALLALIWGHLLDATATYTGIAHFGYLEKHVVPAAAITLTGTALVMFPLKLMVLALALVVIYRTHREYLAANPTLRALLFIGLTLVGLGPGVRDVLRVAMGV